MERHIIVALAALITISVIPSSGMAEPTCAGEGPKTLKEVLAPNSEFPENGARSFRMDLDGDGNKEVFHSLGCGRGFCNLVIYSQSKNNHGKYSCVAGLSVEPESFEVLKRRHHGLPDILALSWAGAGQYRLSRFEFDGQDYNETSGVMGDESFTDLVAPSFSFPER